METRYFLFGTEDTMYNFEEGKITKVDLGLHEVFAYDEQDSDVTELMNYVGDYGFYVEIDEDMFTKILNL